MSRSINATALGLRPFEAGFHAPFIAFKNFSGAPLSPKTGGDDREPDPDRAQRHHEWVFGQRGRSKPATGAAVCAWRGAWGRAAVGDSDSIVVRQKRTLGGSRCDEVRA